jgi:hypothetical protein
MQYFKVFVRILNYCAYTSYIRVSYEGLGQAEKQENGFIWIILKRRCFERDHFSDY